MTKEQHAALAAAVARALALALIQQAHKLTAEAQRILRQ